MAVVVTCDYGTRAELITASGKSSTADRGAVFMRVRLSLFRFCSLLRGRIGLIGLLLDFAIECSRPRA